MQVKGTQESSAELEPARQLDQFFYMNGGGGASYVGLDTFSSNRLGLTDTGGVGPMLDAGAGFRGENFSMGPRLRMTSLDNFNVWEINGEMTAHAPVGQVDGYLGIHAGYVFLNNFSNRIPDATNVQVTGFDVGLHAGWDYYATPELSLGVDFGGEVLFVNRPGYNSRNAAYRVDGQSTGIGGNVTARLGLHF
ncbi:MAG: hypothetical protein ABIP39_08225 [Polyangiaceae bacterium]